MIQFGRDLRMAREAKGLTIAQVAQTTRLMSSMVEDLENENFTKIAAPIYGRGFVKLYCEAVGLDPKPYVAEFIEIYSGNKRTEIKERPVGTPATPPPPPPVMPEPTPQPTPQAAPQPAQQAVPESYIAPAPQPAPVVAPSPEPPVMQIPLPQAAPQPPRVTSHAIEPEPYSVPRQASLFDPPAPPAPPTSPRPAARPAPQPAPQPAPNAESRPLPPPRPARFAPPRMPERERFKLPSIKINLPKIPLVVWRVGALVIAALIVLWLLMIGLRALYRATTGSPNRPPVAAPTEEVAPLKTKQPASTQPASAVRMKRTTLQKIPDLYLD